MDTKPAPQNIQDAFLNTLRRERDAVTIYLVNGAKLVGRIKSFDKFSVLLDSNAQEQLIFKHAISTIIHTRVKTGEFKAPTNAESQSSNPLPTSSTDHDTSTRT